jgi:hypothetical protein
MVRKTIDRIESSGWRHVVRVSAVVAYLAFFWTVVMPIWITDLETRLFPVITPFVLTEVTAQGNDTVVVGRTERIRDCHFEGIDWYVGQRNGTSSRLEEVDFPKGSKARTPGEKILATILIAATPRDVLTNSFANVRYSCYWWQPDHVDTTQVLYDGRGQDASLLADYLLPRVDSLERRVDEISPRGKLGSGEQDDP